MLTRRELMAGALSWAALAGTAPAEPRETPNRSRRRQPGAQSLGAEHSLPGLRRDHRGSYHQAGAQGGEAIRLTGGRLNLPLQEVLPEYWGWTLEQVKHAE